MRIAPAIVVILGVAVASATGCSGSQDVHPEMASSAASVQYAVEWPGHLKTIRTRYADGAKQARADTRSLPGLPEALAEPDWSLAGVIYEQADKAGRSQAVVELILQTRSLEQFVERHGKGVGRRLGGHVKGALKRLDCECEYPSGGMVNAFERAVDDELEARYHELSEAHQILDAQRAALTKQDVETLEGQIDTITGTSFFVYVDAPMLRDELDRLVDEVETVGETLDAAILDHRAALDDEEASRAEKRAAEEQLEALQQARAPLEGAVDETHMLRKNMDADIEELRDAYRSALQQLQDDVFRRVGETAP